MRRRIVHVDQRSGFGGPTSWRLQLDCGHELTQGSPPEGGAAECLRCNPEATGQGALLDVPNATTPDRGSAVVGSTAGEILPPDELLTQLRGIQTKVGALAGSLDGAGERGSVSERLRAIRAQEALQAAEERVGEAVGYLTGELLRPGVTVTTEFLGDDAP